MRIVIDLQGAQGQGRWQRTGHDSLALALAIARHRGAHEVLLALNGLFPESIEPIRALFDGVLPQENIRVWYAPGPVRADDNGNEWRRAVAERVREAFLLNLAPDVVHVASLFEGFHDDAVTSIGAFAPRIPTSAMLPDLIPLRHPETYLLPHPDFARHYAEKLKQLQRAAVWLTTSAATAEIALSWPGADRGQRVEILDDDPADGGPGHGEVVPMASPLWEARARRALAVFASLAAASRDAGQAREATRALRCRLQDAIAPLIPAPPRERDLDDIARAIAAALPDAPQRQLLLDVSGVVAEDAKTGIQRVTRSMLKEFLDRPPAGYRVEPVYATPFGQRYRYARRYTAAFRGQETEGQEDEVIEHGPGDIFLGLDLQHRTLINQHDFLRQLRRDGVKLFFIVYDLLPITMPHAFVLEPDIHSLWLKTITEFDGALCISRAVADELLGWLDAHGRPRLRPYQVNWFHLGADIEQSVPTVGLPDDAEAVLGRIAKVPSFLSVGTVEARKGHQQTLAAFEQLWERGVDVNLVIVGKEGWKVETVVARLNQHPERGKRLFWLKGISDEYLEKIYAAAACLVNASEGEGFGLPLIEAARHRLPIIARGLPVFREVAGDHALYFDGPEPERLATAVEEWLGLAAAGTAPPSTGIRWLTWAESAAQLRERVFGNNAYRLWPPARR